MAGQGGGLTWACHQPARSGLHAKVLKHDSCAWPLLHSSSPDLLLQLQHMHGE